MQPLMDFLHQRALFSAHPTHYSLESNQKNPSDLEAPATLPQR